MPPCGKDREALFRLAGRDVLLHPHVHVFDEFPMLPDSLG